jgi:hypothetical protein
MQPCHVCGSVDVDPHGYCQRCRTYRGDQAGHAGQPQSGAGYDPYASSGSYQPSGYDQQSGYQPGYDQSSYQQPGYQQPGYEQSGYQQSGYQQPAAPPPLAGPPPRSRSFAIPLIALSVIAVILVLGIVAVLVVRAANDSGGGDGDTNAAVDQCVVGNWVVVTSREKLLIEGSNPVEFTSSGATRRLNKDGTGEDSYGAGVVYRGTVNGQSVTVTFTGGYKYNFSTVDGTMTYSNVRANGTAAVAVNGRETTRAPLNNESVPTKYTCSGNSLVYDTELIHTELRRR